MEYLVRSAHTLFSSPLRAEVRYVACDAEDAPWLAASGSRSSADLKLFDVYVTDNVRMRAQVFVGEQGEFTLQTTEMHDGGRRVYVVAMRRISLRFKDENQHVVAEFQFSA